MIVVIGLFLSAVLWISNVQDANIVDNLLTRNDFGDGKNTYSLTVNDGKEQYDISLELLEQEISIDELEALANSAVAQLDTVILGQNESFDKIEYDMNFVKMLDGYPFSIEYSTDYDYINDEGKLVNNVLDNPTIVEIEMTLIYDKFSLIHTVSVMVHTKAIQPTITEQLQEELHIEESENRESKELKLPDKIGDNSLSWNYKRSYTGLLCLIATPILMLFIYITKDKDLHKKVDERREQMMLDYPEIVSALALLIGAGMTVTNAWKKIAYDYKKRRDDGAESRYAYEEMLFTIYEIDSGIIQSTAFERFGRRCHIPCYNKLSTMISQNIRKGAANLPKLLKEEATNAFEERKHLARKQGEQAGTKLLAPMMLLLVVTLVIIMVPAVNTYF
jgi:hypothetical protein